MAHWGFAFDGVTDMMSLNPLEMTNFEMMGAIFGFGGIALTWLLGRLGLHDRQPPHGFTAHEDGQGADPE